MKRAATTRARRARAAGLLVTLALAFAGAARPQSLEYGAYEQLFGEAVTASVTGSPQRQSDVPATMEIVSAEEIRRSGARDIPALLSRIAGIDVRRWSHDHADVAVRGYNQPFTPRLLVLINGRQVYADHYGFTPWPTLPVEFEAIRQIEIVKGPSSALFGFNAVGGVINIITFNPLHEKPRTASAVAGTQSLRGASSVATFDLGEAGAVMLSAGTGENDGFSTPTRQPAPPDVRRGNERDIMSIDAHFGLGDDVELGLETTYSDVAYVELAPIYGLSYSQYETRSVRTHFSADTRYGLVEGALYRNEIDGDVAGTSAGSPLNLDVVNEVTVAQLQDVFKVGTDHTVRVSLEHRENGADTTTVEGGHVHYDISALGGMWDWSIAPSLSLTNALRYDRLSLARRGTMPPGLALENEDWNRTLTERSFNTGLVWQTSERDTLRFMIARGAQLPSLYNLGAGLFELLPFLYGGGYPDVDPSSVTSYEIAWDRELEALDAGLDLRVFHGHTHDMISITGATPPVPGLLGAAGNVGDSHTKGLELAVAGSTGERWRWRASYVYQRIDDELEPGQSLATTLVDFESTTPEHTLKGDFGWSLGRWQFGAAVRYQSEADGIRGLTGALSVTRIPISDFVAIDGRVAYALTERTTLSLSGHNLAHDEQRQTSAAAVERTLLARLDYAF